MEFVGREREIEKLRLIEERSHSVAQFTVISGRRRIGKTELVKKAYEGNPQMLYFFVARKSEVELCRIFIEEMRRKLDVAVPNATFESFADVFRFVMDIAQRQHITLFIDEFQDFFKINPSIYSDMQNIWDSGKRGASINLVVGGSVNTLLNRIFRDEKEPLFGRQTDSLKLQPFTPSLMKYIASKYFPGQSPADFLALYAITGGVAKYVELFVDRQDSTLDKMLSTIFEADSYFLTEGKVLLIEEFGKDYGVYFSILTAIAEGKNTRSEIEDQLGTDAISGHLSRLMDDYELISKLQPIHEASANKNVHYAIRDPFLRFWFRFVYKYWHVIEANGHRSLKLKVAESFPTFSGLALEHYFREVLKETGQYTRLGYWHDRKGNNEIDIVAEDEFGERLELIEVKRSERNIDLSILRSKGDAYLKAVNRYKGYRISYRGLSLENM
ncbi:MAG: ATP-binding protein [Bacteroidales bacterium]|nr:ATP-binding protein [Bacteroidales bacterium]